MPSDYGYINARIKGWHSRLLTAGAVTEIADLPDFPAFLKWMAAGPYAADWQLARARFEGLEAVEQALEANFGQTTRRLLAVSDGAPRRLIGIMLRRWDLANLKTVVRGIARQHGSQEIARNLWPAGNLVMVRLRELAQQRDLRGVADVLATWRDPLAQPLIECLAGFDRDHDLVPVELALDRFHFRDSLRRLRGPESNRSLMAGLLRREIDLANAKTARRLAGQAADQARDPRAYVIDGGEVIDAEAVTELLDPRTRSRRLRALRASPYHGYLAGTGDPVRLEDELDHSFWRHCARLYRARPLAIDVAVGFIWRKQYELVNLRLLARSKFYGLPPEEIRSQLFLDVAGGRCG